MTTPGQSDARLLAARDQLDERDAHIVDLEIAQRRLVHLYEISKVLLRFAGIEQVVPELIARVAKTIPLRSAVFVMNARGPNRAMVWQAQGQSEDRMQAAMDHAQTAYVYLARSSLQIDAAAAHRRELPPLRADQWSEGTPMRLNFVMLPLAVDRRSIFGAVQLEGARPLDERDLVFINAVVNQLAIAIDRQALTDARQLESERSESEQRLVADVSATVGASLHDRAILAALARFAVPRLGELCVIDELLDDGTVERVEVVVADERHLALADELKRVAARGDASAGATLIESGRRLLVSELTGAPVEGLTLGEPDESRDLRDVGIESVLAVPLVARGRVLGRMTLAAIGSGRRYSERDVDLAQEVARRTANAIDNARLYARAQRATRARDNTLAIVSHDLRNPLSSILMALTLMLRIPERRAPPVLVAELERIVRGANRMNRLIQDLLDTASIDAGHLSVEPSALDVAIEVFEALEAARPLAEGKALRLETDLPKDLPSVFGDGPRLQQVFGNLLGNATKFTPPGGKITIGATQSGGVVTFSVTDTGTGIAAAELPRLFDRFWQAPRTAKLGTGLGLFIAQGIIEAHGGRLWVESELGVGTTFSFTLPACDEMIVA